MEFVLTLIPFTLQRYVGAVPPLVTIAEKLTVSPWQHGLDEAAMVMDTGSIGKTVITMGSEVAGLLVAQVRLDVTWQVTMSPFEGAY